MGGRRMGKTLAERSLYVIDHITSISKAGLS